MISRFTLLKGVISTPGSPATDKLRQDLDRTDLPEDSPHTNSHECDRATMLCWKNSGYSQEKLQATFLSGPRQDFLRQRDITISRTGTPSLRDGFSTTAWAQQNNFLLHRTKTKDHRKHLFRDLPIIAPSSTGQNP